MIVNWIPVNFESEIPILLRDPEMYGKYFWTYTRMYDSIEGFMKPAWWDRNNFHDCYTKYITHIAKMEFPAPPEKGE